MSCWWNEAGIFTSAWMQVVQQEQRSSGLQTTAMLRFPVGMWHEFSPSAAAPLLRVGTNMASVCQRRGCFCPDMRKQTTRAASFVHSACQTFLQINTLISQLCDISARCCHGNWLRVY